MIIEFLGVSGVGKTTKAKKYKEQLEREGKEVVWDTFDIYVNKGWFARNVLKGIKVSFYCIKNIKWVIKYKKYISHEIDEKKDRINRLFNGIYLKLLMERCFYDDMIHLFDEGCFQLLWSIKLRGTQSISKEDVDFFIEMFGSPDQLIILKALPEVIAQRIIHRKEYVRISETNDLVKEVAEKQELIEQIEEYANKSIITTSITN